MAKLDYALLADYARVDAAGLLTVVGGSFDRVTSPNEVATHQVHVVLRVFLEEADEEPVPIDVRVVAPDQQYEIGLSTTAQRNPAAKPIDGLTTATLTVGLLAPLPTSGRYIVRILLAGEPVKELPFIVELGVPGPA